MCIFASVAGNATAHLIAAGILRPSVALVIVVAIVPPVGLGVLARLAAAPSTATTADRTTAARTTSGGRRDRSAPAPTTVAEPFMDSVDTPDSNRRRYPEPATRVAKLAAKYPNVSATAMATRLGVSDRTVHRHLAALTVS